VNGAARAVRPGPAARALARVERPLSRAFGGKDNPLHHLGALSIYFFYVALVTGIYLFIFYRTSVDGAWESIESLTREQWYAGGVMRSLHRYASDAAVVTMSLHLLRELLRGRMKGPRWFSWFTGMPLLWIVAVFGISGYWMVWDDLAQYVATATAQLLDWLPIFTDPMSRNFLGNDTVSNRLFTLIGFIHLVGLPIVLVLAIWFHLLRIRHPRINPPRKLMIGSFGALLALSIVMPVYSHAPADFDKATGVVYLDWFYLWIFPLQSATSAGAVWALTAGGTLLMAALPWLPPARRRPVAEVHLPDCNGCGFCVADCPYGAIDLVPRSDGRDGDFEARVDASLCVSCGICTGACPSSSPFRRLRPLTTGIEMPDYTIDAFRAGIDRGRGRAGDAVLVFGCEHGAGIDAAGSERVHTMSLPCIGMVPPAGIDYALRATGYAGVVLSGCEGCDCYHRLGDRWMRERIELERQPGLRRRVPRERVLAVWLKTGDEARLRQEIEAFRAGLSPIDRNEQAPESAPLRRRAAS
jgi:quinol-cytochrome oxidoreductase complex cytochrome b subunit/coenzyme F420-reducing hydrogenase delta subunit